MIAPRILARTNRDEAIAPLGVGDGLSGSSEVGVQRRIMLIDFVTVSARRIRLPDFHDGVCQRTAVFVEHSPAHDDAFAKRFPMVPKRQVVGFGRNDFGIE